MSGGKFVFEEAFEVIRMRFHPVRYLIAATLFSCSAIAASFAADEPGSKDHPLLGRFEGSEISFYKTADFDEAALLQAPHNLSALLDRDALKDRSGPEWLNVEGRVTMIRYAIPTGHSSLEVTRNYEAALKAKGFTIAFSCIDQACLEGKLRDPYLLGQQIDTANNLSTAYFDHARYMLAKADLPQGQVYASILTGEDKDVVTAFVEVVETKAMETNKIVSVKADQMEQALEANNKIDIYGILFDFDKATLRPESKPTMDEIAKLLRDKPDLRLQIVGHTDNVGKPDYNLNLSARRAESVLTALVQDYTIAPDRLSSSGAGQTVPVASNDTDEGRAKNRRVELKAVK